MAETTTETTKFEPDPRLARELRERVAEIERRATREDVQAYADGEELVEIERLGLHRHGGYPTMSAFLAGAFKRLPASSARERWQVAKHFPKPFACEHGLTKCYYALRILREKPGEQWPVEALKLEIPAVRGGRDVRVPFAEAGANEVRDEAQRLGLRRRAALPHFGLPPDLREELAPLIEALRPLQRRNAPLVLSAGRPAGDRTMLRINLEKGRLRVLHEALGAYLRRRSN